MKLNPQQLKTIDYTSIFRAKLTFRLGFKSYTLPYTFVLEDIIIYGVSLYLVRTLLGRVIDTIGSLIMFGSFALSLVLPYLMLRLIKKLPTDGKPIFYYLYDTAMYYMNVLLPKKTIYKGEYKKPQADIIVFKKE